MMRLPPLHFFPSWRMWMAIVITVSILFLLWILFFPQAVSSKTELHIAGRTIVLDIANTPIARLRGLSGRGSMARDHGMLFVFPKRDIYSFWMGGMKFPLDLVWIDHGVIVDIKTLPAPTSTFAMPARYTPRGPADRVLEINAGMVKELGMREGGQLVLP